MEIASSTFVEKVHGQVLEVCYFINEEIKANCAYLAEGYSRLDVSAEAMRLWYSVQIEGRPSPKLFTSSRHGIIAAAILIERLY
eukprot:1147554-Pelagomonas_calceolata.AAC.1